MNGKRHHVAPLVAATTLAASAALVGTLTFTASAAAEPRPVATPALAGVATLPGPVAAPSVPSPQGLKLLKATPDSGYVGTTFTLTGEKLPANADVDIVWSTANARYVLNVLADNVEYYGRKLDSVNVVLAKARTDAAGNLSAPLRAPRDFGSVHDIYAVVNGVQVAKAGFQINRKVTVTPKQGPIGTPITIAVTGLGAHPYLSTLAVMYDNKYTGFISTTNTRGSSTVTIRAAGPVGARAIEVAPASAAVPYLDIEQSAVSFIGKYRTTFRVTKDAGAPATQIVFPENVTPTVDQRTTFAATTAAGVSARLSAESGPILSKVRVNASGLAPNGDVLLQWITAVGTRATTSGWSLVPLPLGQGRTSGEGKLSSDITVPDNLGGWHTIELVQGGKVKAQVPYYVERSLVEITPTKVRVGQPFTIHVKGIGWTELDNTLTVAYDNGYIGYACGFYSRGDINMNLIATGAPGTHLIDLYPTTYKGKATDTWLEQMPFLSYRQDFPGLALGYRLPAIHLAIHVTR